jgi:hypothetical protein
MPVEPGGLDSESRAFLPSWACGQIVQVARQLRVRQASSWQSSSESEPENQQTGVLSLYHIIIFPVYYTHYNTIMALIYHLFFWQISRQLYHIIALSRNGLLYRDYSITYDIQVTIISLIFLYIYYGYYCYYHTIMCALIICIISIICIIRIIFMIHIICRFAGFWTCGSRVAGQESNDCPIR